MKLKQITFSASVAAILLLSMACQTVKHPNQLNDFDGDCYDTLTASRAALVSLRSKVQTSYPKYTDEANTALASFNTAVVSYTVFRQAPTTDEVVLAGQLASITASIVALESQISADMKVSPVAVAKARATVQQKRGQFNQRTLKAHVSFADVMAELQIFAAIAQVIPVTSPYASLAQLLIEATNQAVIAVQSKAGTPIDLTSLAPISLIPVAAQ